MRIFRIILILISMLCISHYAQAQQIVLYGAAGVGTCDTQPALQRSLYTLDPSTGSMQLVGTPGFDGVTALAQLNDGRLVATAIQDNETSILIEINPLTGQGSLIGIIGNFNNPNECARIPGLAYDSTTDTLYGLARFCSGELSRPLVVINPDTAEMTPVGNTSISGGGFGLALRNDGTLFAAATQGTTMSLHTINKDTGVSNLIGSMETNGVTPGGLAPGGLAFHPLTQELYASVNNTDVGPTDSYLLTTNETAPPSFDVVGQTADCFDGLTFAVTKEINVPTLSQWALLATAGILGFISFIVIRKKQLIVKS